MYEWRGDAKLTILIGRWWRLENQQNLCGKNSLGRSKSSLEDKQSISMSSHVGLEEWQTQPRQKPLEYHFNIRFNPFQSKKVNPTGDRRFWSETVKPATPTLPSGWACLRSWMETYGKEPGDLVETCRNHSSGSSAALSTAPVKEKLPIAEKTWTNELTMRINHNHNHGCPKFIIFHSHVGKTDPELSLFEPLLCDGLAVQHSLMTSQKHAKNIQNHRGRLQSPGL